MNTTTKPATRLRLGLLAAGLCALPGLLQAQPSAHYAPGAEGIKGASLPPPGIYARDYNLFYYSDRLNDPKGNRLQVPGLDPKLFLYANLPRVVWITDVQPLGGFLGVDALLPLVYKDLELFGSKQDNFGVGDVFFEGTWSWHPKQFDISVGYGVWAPTGDFSVNDPTLPGAGFWTHMLTAGATWYIDSEKLWAVSALNRYEISQEQEDTGITPGQVYTLEWGVSRALSKTVDVGAIGYYQQQVTANSGSSDASRSRVAGVGPEVAVFYPRYTLGWSLRYAYEFMAENRFQGQTLTFTVTKRF